MNKKILTSPYDIVAKTLEIDKKYLNENSAMGETPNWDSLNHFCLIGDIESEYDIQIPNNEIEQYTTMKAIINLYKKQNGEIGSKNSIVSFLKKIPIVKILFK